MTLKASVNGVLSKHVPGSRSASARSSVAHADRLSSALPGVV